MLWLQEEAGAPLGPGTKVVYVSRNDTVSSGKGIRVLGNEAILVDALKAAVGEDNLRIFIGRNHTVTEQYKIFASAAVVVSPHGAGLSNLAACAPGTAFMM